MKEQVIRCGIKVEKYEKGMWSICFGLTHWFDETYIYINLFKWSIAIGKMYLSKLN